MCKTGVNPSRSGRSGTGKAPSGAVGRTRGGHRGREGSRALTRDEIREEDLAGGVGKGDFGEFVAVMSWEREV